MHAIRTGTGVLAHFRWHFVSLTRAERRLDQVRRTVQSVGGLDARPKQSGPHAIGWVAQDGADRDAEAFERQSRNRD